MNAQEEISHFCDRLGISPPTLFLIVYKDAEKARRKYAEWKRTGEEDQIVRRYIQRIIQ